jgi:hypothetical protein
MRHILFGVLLALVAGCATTQDQRVIDAATHNLEGLQLLEKELLERVPNDAPIDFATLGGSNGIAPVLYRPRDGWRIVLRSYQLRAAGLVAWAKGEEFDSDAGLQALVVPAVAAAKANLPDDE